MKSEGLYTNYKNIVAHLGNKTELRRQCKNCTAAFVLFRVSELGILLHVFMLIALGDNALATVYHIDSATARALHLLTHHVVDALDG